MRLCSHCGEWEFKARTFGDGAGCQKCGYPFSNFTRVYPPVDLGDGRTPPKTPRQEEDDR